MRRTALAGAVALAALAAVAAAATSRAPAVAVPKAVKAPAKRGPLLAVVPGDRGPVLGRADKRALWIGRRSPRLRIFNWVSAWAYSADHERLALGTEESGAAPRLQIITPHSLRRSGIARLGRGHVAALAWAPDGVNAVVERFCCGSVEIVTIDPETMKVSSRAQLPNTLLAKARSGSTLVLLLGPRIDLGIGQATLAVVDPTGDVRTAALTGISAGRQHGEATVPPDFSKFRQNVPGLAVDPETNRAFVIPASGDVAEIALGSLAVSYHGVAQPVSLFGRVRDLLEPKASAKGLNGPVRTARWLGSGVMAVTGADEALFEDANGERRMTWTPAGLKLIDTNTWGSKLIDRGADRFTVDGGTLLATGSRWDSREAAPTGMGLAAYGLDGTRRLSVLGGHRLWVMLSFRGRAYVTDDDVLRVVDLTTGDVKRRLAPLPQLLIGDAST